MKQTDNSKAKNAIRSAKDAGLVHSSDTQSGIQRVRRGKSFVYLKANRKPVSDTATLNRIKSLVIPPAWEDVWICSSPRGHLQATGRDVRGRKQAKYHPRFREVRDSNKYDRVIELARVLPKIRRTVRKHLQYAGMPRVKVLAAIVSLLDKTLIRIGNEKYASDNHHYGLTTIRNKHVQVNGSTIKFKFIGKSGVHHDIDLQSPKLARIVRKCQELPGQDLFAYVDEEGKVHDVKSNDVNAYLVEITGQSFTSKDFRTFAGTVLAATALREFEQFDSQAQAKKYLVRAIEHVAERLGNTKAVCRKCYVHPMILESYLDGSLIKSLQKKAEHEMSEGKYLTAHEAAVMGMLQQRLKNASHGSAG